MKHTQKAIALFILLAASVLVLFAQIEPIGIGNAPNDGTGDTLRGAFIKVNTNFWWLTNNFKITGDSIASPASAGANSIGSQSVIIGHDAGAPSSSVMIGHGAGRYSTFGGNVMIGVNSGGYATNSGDNVFVGSSTAQYADAASQLTAIGQLAGQYATNADGSAFLGRHTGRYASESQQMVAIGNFSSSYAFNADYTVAGGYNSAYAASNAQYSIFLGYDSGRYATTGSHSIFIGRDAGRNGTNSSLSIFLGYNAGRDISRSNTLIIDARATTEGTNGLIYGEFDNRLLRVNGNLEFTNGLYSYVAGSKQPLHPFASLMLVGDENLNLASSGTYYQITNYDAMVTNYFSGVATNGVLTNTIAGYYKVSTTCSFDGSGGVNDLFECAVFTNTVECALVEWHRKTGSSDTGSAGATGIIYLPANTRVDARIQNTASSGTITLRHFNLTVTTP